MSATVTPIFPPDPNTPKQLRQQRVVRLRDNRGKLDVGIAPDLLLHFFGDELRERFDLPQEQEHDLATDHDDTGPRP